MPRNHDDLADFENRNTRCKSTFMSAASQKNSDRYLLNSGLYATNGRPAGRTPALILELCFSIIILDHRSNILI